VKQNRRTALHAQHRYLKGLLTLTMKKRPPASPTASVWNKEGIARKTLRDPKCDDPGEEELPG
jgi:hypothetical protein